MTGHAEFFFFRKKTSRFLEILQGFWTKHLGYFQGCPTVGGCFGWIEKLESGKVEGKKASLLLGLLCFFLGTQRSGQFIATSNASFHPKWLFRKGNPLISGKSRMVKYYNLAR